MVALYKHFRRKYNTLSLDNDPVVVSGTGTRGCDFGAAEIDWLRFLHLSRQSDRGSKPLGEDRRDELTMIAELSNLVSVSRLSSNERTEIDLGK